MCRFRTGGGGGGENKNSKPSPARVTFGLAQIFFEKNRKLHLKFYLGKRRQLDPSVAFSPNVFGGGGVLGDVFNVPAEFLHLDTFQSGEKRRGEWKGENFSAVFFFRIERKTSPPSSFLFPIKLETGGCGRPRFSHIFILNFCTNILDPAPEIWESGGWREE